MAQYQVRTFIGVFTVDGSMKVVSFKPFPKDPMAVAEELMHVSEKIPREIEDSVKGNLLKYALEKKIFKDQVEFNQFLTSVNSELAKQKIKEHASRDSIVIHVNNAIEELDRSINIFVERLREWYSLHFPEMDRTIDDHETYVKIVEKFGDRRSIDDTRLAGLKNKSFGMELNESDISAVRLFSSDISKLYELRKEFLIYLGKLLKEVAPNFTVLAGDTIAAKLIAKANGLERLSRLPSSTIQLLGSEKALFRFLKSRGKSRSPKHGLIFNHPLIQNSPREKQGRVARLLAAKLSIAARIDYYAKEYKGDKMKKELEAKIKEILSAKE